MPLPSSSSPSSPSSSSSSSLHPTPWSPSNCIRAELLGGTLHYTRSSKGSGRGAGGIEKGKGERRKGTPGSGSVDDAHGLFIGSSSSKALVPLHRVDGKRIGALVEHWIALIDGMEIGRANEAYAVAAASAAVEVRWVCSISSILYSLCLSLLSLVSHLSLSPCVRVRVCVRVPSAHLARACCGMCSASAACRSSRPARAQTASTASSEMIMTMTLRPCFACSVCSTEGGGEC